MLSCTSWTNRISTRTASAGSTSPFLLRLFGVRDGGLDLRLRGERDACLDFTGAGFEDVPESSGRPGDMLAADEMGEFSNAHVDQSFEIVVSMT